jgi:hypothetical protein
MAHDASWRTAAIGLSALSVILFVAGMSLTTAFAPCYNSGEVVTVVSLAVAALSCVTLALAATKAQLSWAWCVVSALVTASCLFVGYLWTVLLCRGV